MGIDWVGRRAGGTQLAIGNDQIRVDRVGATGDTCFLRVVMDYAHAP